MAKKMTAKPSSVNKNVQTVGSSTNKTVVRAVTHQQIAERAYTLFLKRGGNELENWLQAERELRTETPRA